MENYRSNGNLKISQKYDKKIQFYGQKKRENQKRELL
jgi:hypothetical protein